MTNVFGYNYKRVDNLLTIMNIINDNEYVMVYHHKPQIILLCLLLCIGIHQKS